MPDVYRAVDDLNEVRHVRLALHLRGKGPLIRASHADVAARQSLPPFPMNLATPSVTQSTC